MLFNSLQFLVFFPLVLSVYYIIPDKMKNFWLLLCSYYFYMCWNAKYVLLIFISTLITYASAIIIERFRETEKEAEKKQKTVLLFCILIDLSFLFYYKYSNFALNLINHLFAILGIHILLPPIDIVLPVGISFYTFQTISYLIDVYRGETPAEKSFLKYALFISFFPQLVAGPIERSKNILKQLSVSHRFNYENARDGVLLMLWGFFLKIVVADRIAIFVNAVYGDFDSFPGFHLVIATALFAIQIYCDFYGYSTIAVGAAELLGIRLMENFNAPYLSVSVAEFWRKWHISLTSWFRDYLYIPLGGSRKGKARHYLNILLIFMVSGLWHGADMTFVIWGLINGMYQIIGSILRPVKAAIAVRLHIDRETLLYRLIQMSVTFVLICFSWIFFRASDMNEAVTVIRSMITNHNMWDVIKNRSFYQCGLGFWDFWFMLASIFVLMVADIGKKKGIIIRERICRLPVLLRCAAIAAAICAIVLFGVWGPAFDQSQFIYFQF